jgi:hypothetical protein
MSFVAAVKASFSNAELEYFVDEFEGYEEADPLGEEGALAKRFACLQELLPLAGCV